jgi:energy-converting hydrogenase Eha subunit G
MTRVNFVNLLVCRDLILESLTNRSSRDAGVWLISFSSMSMSTENWGFLRGLSGLGLFAVFWLMGAHVMFLEPVAE